MDAPRSQSEAGFGLIELLISMVILQVALLALISVFSSSAVALGRSGSWTSAAVLADARMELYRSMPYDAIGLDITTANVPTTGPYVSDLGVCPTGQTPVCANTGPRNNANTSTWSCVFASGVTSVSTYFSANGINPCVAHRPVTGTTSPDGKPYDVDTYITWSIAHVGQRGTKTVSVVVRKSGSTTELAKLITSFDCSTGQPTANTNGC
jgi:type II secretory pathway pseudopilin PulG